MDALLRMFWLLAAWLGGADADPECLLLGGLDVARAEAFVAGDEAGLRAVYADQAARADLRVLRSYRERGLRLQGMLMVRESCRVSDREPERIVLDVVDRLGPTRVTTAGGKEQALPRDRPTRHAVVLVRTPAGWRIAAVRPGPPDL